MRYINWNIKCFCEVEKIIALLDSKLQTRDCIIALQEVMPDRAERLREHYESDFNIVYSIDYRIPDEEFDTNNRRLGVMLIASRDFEVVESGVFERCLFPERTLYATLSLGEQKLKVVSMHSLTGVSFKMAKAVQFRSFAECIRDYKPDIVSFDANEPKADHYDISKMEFFDQGDKGQGARLFFEELIKQGMSDAFATLYDKSSYIPGEPLITSHIINKKINRRYDFVFVNNQYKTLSVDYLYDEAVKASSDHAMIVADNES